MPTTRHGGSISFGPANMVSAHEAARIPAVRLRTPEQVAEIREVSRFFLDLMKVHGVNPVMFKIDQNVARQHRNRASDLNWDIN